MIRNEVDFSSIFPLLSYKLGIVDLVFCLVTQLYPTVNLCPDFGNYFPECYYLFPLQIHFLRCFSTELCCLLIICFIEYVWPVLEQSLNNHVPKVTITQFSHPFSPPLIRDTRYLGLLVWTYR